ncbi:MAG: PEP-CTERM sorting domain-containing protein [Gammaproteobacteria bacterium]
MPIKTILCALLVSQPLMTSSANELVLDWDSLTWSPEGQSNLSETYQLGGSDVVVIVGGNTSGLDDTGTVSPRIDDNQTGGLAPVENSLIISTDYPISDLDREVTISFDFSDYTGGVSNLSFDVFDVDQSGSFVDEIMVTALVNGEVVDPTQLTTGLANVATGANTVQGSQTSIPDSSDGNVGIAFAYSGITELLITYRNVGPTNNAGFQSIGIHDISFTPVPLPGSLLLFGSSLAGLMFHRRRSLRD